MMATASDSSAAPPTGKYLFCSGGQLRLLEIREAASTADRKKWEDSPPVAHELEGESERRQAEALGRINTDNLKEDVTEARLDWFIDTELPEDQQALYEGTMACLHFPFTTHVWLPDESIVKVKVTGFIDGQDGVERPGTGCGFEVEYMDHKLMLPVDAFVNELSDPDNLDDEWLDSPAAVPAKVFAVVRDFYDNAIFTEGYKFGSIWDDVRYDVDHTDQDVEIKKWQKSKKNNYLKTPPPIKKIRNFPKMDSESRLECVVDTFPLYQMPLAFHTYLSSVAKFPFDLKLKYGGGVVKATGMIPYKANNLFQESRGIYVTVDLSAAHAGAPPSKKAKKGSKRVVAVSVHGVEACDSTPLPVRRFLEDIAELMDDETGLCVLKTRFQAVSLVPCKLKQRWVKRPDLVNRDLYHWAAVSDL